MLALKVLGKDLFQAVLFASDGLPAVLDCDNKTPSLTWWHDVFSIYTCVLSHFSCVQLFDTLRTVDLGAPLSMEFSRQGYWSGLPYPPPRDLANPGIKPTSSALAGRFFTTSTTWEAPLNTCLCLNFIFYEDTQHIGLRTRPTPVWSYLYWLHMNDSTSK